MELLIVGFALLIVVNVPDKLSNLMVNWETTISADFVNVLLYFGAIAQVASRILLINLIIHVILRGFWIGIVGLNSVYPNGIKFDNLNFSSRFNKFIKTKVKELDKFAVTIDNIASSIFAFTFLLIFIFFSLSLYFAVLILGIAVLLVSVEKILPDWLNTILYNFYFSYSNFTLYNCRYISSIRFSWTGLS